MKKICECSKHSKGKYKYIWKYVLVYGIKWVFYSYHNEKFLKATFLTNSLGHSY